MTPFPVTETTLLIPGPAGTLEVLAAPAKVNAKPHAAIGIICHPHPLYSGTMHNKVVTTLKRVFSDLGMPSVRFNFRGVGHSTGTYDEGIGETEDALAVVAWAKSFFPNADVWIAGFSFGSIIAARVASQMPVAQLISVAPPVERFNLTGLSINCPWTVVQGEADDVVSPEAVYAWVKTALPQPDLIRIKDAGHFFHKKLLELRDVLEQKFMQ